MRERLVLPETDSFRLMHVSALPCPMPLHPFVPPQSSPSTSNGRFSPNSSDPINYDCSCSTPSNICFAQLNPGSYSWNLHFERVEPIEIYCSPSHFLQEEFNWAILGQGLHSWMYLIYHFEVRESSMMWP